MYFADAALEQYSVRSYTLLRMVTALLSSVIHFAMWVATGSVEWLVLTGLGVLHGLVIIPAGSRLGLSHTRTAGSDLLAILAGAILLGDPVPTAFWVPTVMFSGVVFGTTRQSFEGLAMSVGTLIIAFSGVWFGWMNRPLTQQEIGLYALLAMVIWVVVMVGYTFLVSSAVHRRERDLRRSQEAADGANRLADTQTMLIESILEAVPIGIAFQDDSGAFLITNTRLRDILQRSEEHLRTRGAVDTMHPDDLMELEALVQRARTSGKLLSTEYSTVDGRRVVHHLNGIPTPDGVMGTVTALQDVTIERQITTRLRRFSSALEATPDLVVMWNERGEVLHTNRAFKDFWHMTTDGTGSQLHDVVGTEVASVWTAFGRSDEQQITEMDIMSPTDVVVPMSVVVQPDGDAATKQTVFTAVARDITEIVAARQSLQDLISSKDEFIASVSHELRTPLTAVVGLAAELAAVDDDFDREETRELADIIAEQSNDVAAIVEDLLMAARADAGVLTVDATVIDVDLQIADAFLALPADFAAGIRIEPFPDLRIIGDPGRVRQIIRNLLTNARRYGGNDVEISVSATPTAATIEISDDGAPIAPAKRAEMFAAYGRAHTRVGQPDSVGLGLTVSRTLARLMGGDVVYTHEGGRSRFRLSLPLACDELDAKAS